MREAINHFIAQGYSKDSKISTSLKQIIESIQGQLEEYEYPGIHLDVLHDTEGNILMHPTDTERLKEVPKIYYGKIGSANTLLKDSEFRDALRDEHQVMANEMEGSGIADATWISGREGYLIIRGICDYCDTHKNDVWQKYAACVAAAYTKNVNKVNTNCCFFKKSFGANSKNWANYK